MIEEVKHPDSESTNVSGNLNVEVAAADGKVEEAAEASTSDVQLEWYILKVQSNREDSVKRNLEKRIKVAGLEKYFGHIIVPTESVTELKNGKRKVVKHKLYPGYVIIQMQINDDSWYLVRQTSGIGDFAATDDGKDRKPITMLPEEVEKILQMEAKESDDTAVGGLRITFTVGSNVKVTDGTFQNYEGFVDSIDPASGKVTVMISYFGRSTPVELEYWQVEAI
ncbi:MAG: transcription termination/antitermination protein NusG [Thermoguttaceae bacterium]|nr:transcription termination/antitermination protein NusG [Thermoguttaceae bacterium]